MPLYLTLELCSLFIPLIFSFDKKLKFYQYWRTLFLSIVITGIFFIAVDIFFTRQGIWGFNLRYHSNIFIVSLPLEEWLFFVVIPYASIFIHYVFFCYYPGVFLNDRFTRIVTWIILTGTTLVILFNTDKTYTLVYSFILIGGLILSLFDKSQTINRFYVSFLIILIPFFIINAILTGSFITDEVVWYNNSEITGVRIFTVPVEDIAYGFSLILLNLLLMSNFQKVFNRKHMK